MYFGSLTSLINRMVLVAHIFGFTNYTNKFYNILDHHFHLSHLHSSLSETRLWGIIKESHQLYTLELAFPAFLARIYPFRSYWSYLIFENDITNFFYFNKCDDYSHNITSLRQIMGKVVALVTNIYSMSIPTIQHLILMQGLGYTLTIKRIGVHTTKVIQNLEDSTRTPQRSSRISRIVALYVIYHCYLNHNKFLLILQLENRNTSLIILLNKAHNNCVYK